MRKLISLTLMLLVVLPVLAQNNEANIKAAVEDRYKEWLAAANKKDAEALTNLYDENAVLMPKQEEPVIGKAAIGEYYKKLVADPHFVPFTATFESNSFHVVGDIAIETADFDGELTRDGKQIISTARTCLYGRSKKTVRGRSSATCSMKSPRRNNMGGRSGSQVMPTQTHPHNEAHIIQGSPTWESGRIAVAVGILRTSRSWISMQEIRIMEGV